MTIRFLLITEILLASTFVSCDSTAVRFRGTIHEVNVEIPKYMTIGLAFYDLVNDETDQEEVRVRLNGQFKSRIKASGKYLADISAYGYISNSSTPYLLSTDWIINNPIFINPGDDILLEDLYLSSEFSLLTAYEDNTITSIDEMMFSWDPISAADYYVIYVSRLEEGAEHNVILYATDETDLSGSLMAPLISYETEMTPSEVRQNVPFYRVKENLTDGQYEFEVVAVKESMSGFESTIARSKVYDVVLSEEP